MAQDSTAFEAALKEGYTQDSLESQIYSDNPALEGIERIKPAHQVGDKAITPVHTGRAGGFSMVPRTGSTSLNAADAQEVNQATWNYAHAWKQISIDTAVVDESSNSGLAVAQAVDVEVSGALDDMRKQLTRQIFGNGDALIARCDTGGASTTIELRASAGDLGFDAIERGWLYPGQQIDIGTTADEDSQVAGAVIQSVSESSTDPDIVIDSSISTTTSHYVSIADARSGTTSYESNGFQNIVSESATLGGLATATVPGWKAAKVDSTSQALSLPVLYAIQRQIFQKTGKDPDWALTSPRQREYLYTALQSQVRFAGDGGLGAGNMDRLMLGKTAVDAQPDCPNSHFWFLSKKHLHAIRTEKPAWAPQKYSHGKILEWQQGTTRLVSGLVYRFQIGTNRRNAHGGLTGLTWTA